MSELNIYQKLIEVRKTVPYLQKENKGQQYAYVSSSQVLGAFKAKMDELGLLLIPRILSHKIIESTVEYVENQKPKRTTTYFTELDMQFTWINAEKPTEYIECPFYAQGVDIAGEKGVGKALTYAEKYFLLKFFNVPTDKDDPDSFQNRLEDDKPNNKKNDSKKEPKKEEPKKETKQTTIKTGDGVPMQVPIKSNPKPLVELLSSKFPNNTANVAKELCGKYNKTKTNELTADEIVAVIENINNMSEKELHQLAAL